MTDDTSHTAATNGTDPSVGGQQRRKAAHRARTRLLSDQLDRVQVSAGQRVLDLTRAAALPTRDTPVRSRPSPGDRYPVLRGEQI
ncbi:hypothetical protein AB0B57_02790 [Micromonospora sp. NPDC049101]|uniref:hypothetical protein n=1 Tax=Micromonospora sp. NPDC049101 TaxID=3155032 RepID=UPI0033EE877D